MVNRANFFQHQISKWILLTLLASLIISLLPAYAQNTEVDLCVRDFQDANQNGQFDNGEQNLSGVEVFVTNASDGQLLGSMTTTPDLDCLRTIPAGDYDVEFRDSTYQPTTPTQLRVTVTDQTVTVDYGATLLTNSGENTPVAQNAPGNQICIIVFRDDNTNGSREGTEGLIGSIDVNLTVDDIIIDTLITTEQDYACFTDLPAGPYRVIIPDTPRHILINRNDFSPTFATVGEVIEVDFGALLLDPFSDDALLPNYGRSDDKFTLDDQARLILAIFGAGTVILFMVGFGAILLSIIRR